MEMQAWRPVKAEMPRHGDELGEFDKPGTPPDAAVTLPADGVLTHGLFTEAGRFDRKKMLMAESRPGELFDEMPCIHMKPIATAEGCRV